MMALSAGISPSSMGVMGILILCVFKGLLEDAMRTMGVFASIRSCGIVLRNSSGFDLRILSIRTSSWPLSKK